MPNPIENKIEDYYDSDSEDENIERSACRKCGYVYYFNADVDILNERCGYDICQICAFLRQMFPYNDPNSTENFVNGFMDASNS